jgi:hypothetical protein
MRFQTPGGVSYGSEAEPDSAAREMREGRGFEVPAVPVASLLVRLEGLLLDAEQEARSWERAEHMAMEALGREQSRRHAAEGAIDRLASWAKRRDAEVARTVLSVSDRAVEAGRIVRALAEIRQQPGIEDMRRVLDDFQILAVAAREWVEGGAEPDPDPGIFAGRPVTFPERFEPDEDDDDRGMRDTEADVDEEMHGALGEDPR